jgi:ABC-type bacteriocin/lantibiotic exporter with double-glycine peptidase domain
MDIPLERRSGYHLLHHEKQGMDLEIKDLHFSYPENERPSIAGISLHLEPGNALCISGQSNAGKNTLVKLLLGFFNGYSGMITFNGLSIRDISLPSLRSYIGENVLNNTIYDSTILYNITMGRSEATAEKVAEIIHDLKLAGTLFNNPEGLNAPILSGNFRLSESAKYKLTLARALVTNPKLVLIDDTILTLERSEKLQILSYLMDKKHGWSLIFISNDTAIANLCDQHMYLEDGKMANKNLD